MSKLRLQTYSDNDDDERHNYQQNDCSTVLLDTDMKENIHLAATTMANTNDNIDILSNIIGQRSIEINDSCNFDNLLPKEENLANNFDEQIFKCFPNFSDEENAKRLSPAIVRSLEDTINDDEMWFKLTNNFGNALPVKWFDSYARKRQLPSLNLNQPRDSPQEDSPADSDTSSLDEEELAKDLDLHSLILSSIPQEPPIFTAEQIIEEIDEMLMNNNLSSSEEDEHSAGCNRKSDRLTTHNPIESLMYQEKLATLSISQLNELYMDLERMIQDYSETLIQELALRDELEFEKELKNNFISLLLSIQNKRRQHKMEGNKVKSDEPRYLTTVIPYDANGPPDVHTIQILIKILKAVNDDSPTVPALLTDFILKVLVPT